MEVETEAWGLTWASRSLGIESWNDIGCQVPHFTLEESEDQVLLQGILGSEDQRSSSNPIPLAPEAVNIFPLSSHLASRWL